MTGVINGIFSFSINARSTLIIGSPAFTLSFTFFNTSKPCPFKFTVSKPQCTRTSIPSGLVIPNAWCESINMVIVPSIGAHKTSPVGSIAIPSPIIFSENTSSGTSLKSLHTPSIGALIVKFLLFFLNIENISYTSPSSWLHYIMKESMFPCSGLFSY